MKLKTFLLFGLLLISFVILLQRGTNPTSIFTTFLFKNTSDGIQPPHSHKTILYWTPMVNHLDWYLGLGSEIFQNCTYNNCFTTYHKNLIPIDRFDAVLFHGYEYNELKFGKPEKRDPKQVYVFGNIESPSRTPNYIDEHTNFYNWTLTYRDDSDVVRKYGYIEDKITGYQPPSIQEIKKRPKKIVWFVSNCNTPSKRELIYEHMKKYLPIDVYGNCHQLKCSRNNEDECYDMMEEDYKFYLAFENSVCDQYVTEKLYNVLQRNVVPIVYGGANYSAIAPPNSVINVMDFGSMKELVQYIKYLDENPAEYLKYFEWKKMKASVRDEHFLCDLCRKLNQPIMPKTYPDITSWWRGKDGEHCTNKFVDTFL